MTSRAVKQAVIPGSQIDWRVHLQRLPRLLLLAAVLSLLVMGLMKANEPGFMPIEKIRAQGEFINLTEAMLLSQAGNIQGGYFNINVGSVQQKIESLAWVDRAYVRRLWPDTLMITVVEQKAQACWDDKGLINARGELFFPDRKTFPAGLPKLSGPDGTHGQLLEDYKNMSRIMAETGLLIQRISMDARRSLTLHFDNGMKILLGRVAHYVRLERFMRIYKKLLVTEINQLQQIDMRYTNGFTILRKQ